MYLPCKDDEKNRKNILTEHTHTKKQRDKQLAALLLNCGTHVVYCVLLVAVTHASNRYWWNRRPYHQSFLPYRYSIPRRAVIRKLLSLFFFFFFCRMEETSPFFVSLKLLPTGCAFCIEFTVFHFCRKI